MVVLRSATPEDALGITIVNVYTWKTAYTGLVADALIDERIRCLQERAAITRQTIAQEKACFVVAVDGAAVAPRWRAAIRRARAPARRRRAA